MSEFTCPTCNGNSYYAAKRIAALEVQVAEVERKYRQQLWSSHGHAGIYGDDGEMQCSECGVDYKRDPLATVEAAFMQANLVRG